MKGSSFLLRRQLSNTEALVAMRAGIVLCLGLIVAYWLDQRYYYGLYSREIGNMLREIAVSFRQSGLARKLAKFAATTCRSGGDRKRSAANRRKSEAA
jgi:hypothetical protein